MNAHGSYDVFAHQPEWQPQRGNPLTQRTGLLAAGAVIAVVVTIGALAAASGSEPRLQSALDTCSVPTSEAFVEDGGTSLTLEGSGEDDRYGLDYHSTECVLRALAVPAWVVSRMEGTRAVDGTQTAEWDEMEVSWNYHPDDGLDIVLVDRAG